MTEIIAIKMLKILLFIYHGIFPSINRNCRYTPTCSQYALDAVAKYGIINGSIQSLKRLSSCHPLSTRPTYDPI